MSFEFPFSVPGDFAQASTADLRTALNAVVDFSAQYAALGADEHTDASLAALEASATLASQLGDALRARSEQFARATAAPIATFASDADGDEDEDGEDGGDDADGEALEGEVEAPAAVTASSGRGAQVQVRTNTRPGVRQLSGRPAAQVELPQQRLVGATMRVAGEVSGFQSGQELSSFSDASRALSAVIDRHPTMTAGRATYSKGKRPVTVYERTADGSRPAGRRLEMTKFQRLNGVQFVRDFPAELRVTDGQNALAVAEFAANERNLPGKSLVESMKLRLKAGRSITAAAAWCAISEVIYQLCELESMDGLWSGPELQTNRGGWQIPIDGGPNFATIWNGIGNAGNTHLTEEDVQDDVQKVCTEIPCPDFEDIRLGVDYVCLTGGLLQRRGYPEIVARFSRGAMIALAHKINQGVIATMVAASGPATVIPQVVTGDDAASAILAAVELAITDIKYANRMAFNLTLETIMPMWFLPQIRAALARRRGIKALDVTDAEIMDWFAIRKTAPQFVYDWQDAYTGLPEGPGGATPLEALPTSGQFLVYPAGTWVKAVQDVVSLDTIYDSTNLQTNQYTAIFAEDGWAMLQMCPDSRLYEVALDPSGVVGCCPPELISL